jgi:pimeloyl-ACP methyl ester carboxylesterase
MSLARLLGVCGLAIGATASQAQVIPTNKLPDETMVSAIPQSTRDGFYSDLHEARRKNAPRIVFVPGILGSKIDECRADGSQCTNIWGTIGAVTRRNVDLSLRSDRVYRTDVVESLFFTNVYGRAIDYIRAKAEFVGTDSIDDALVTVFHYDWRRSNSDNAKLLKKRICDVRANAAKSPIYIVAHSMGGLVTKVWAARHANEPCSNGEKPEVTQIVFVATPHLGSPKAIKALADGYNILFDELAGLKRRLGLGWLEQNYLLNAVNQAGISFPSLYELLPIRTSEYCRQQKPELGKASNPVDGDDNKPINLFDVENWRRYDLLRRIGAPAVRRSYYEHDLAPLLRQAEQLLCEIVDFDPRTVADVIYLFGREKDDRTYGWFQLHAGAANSIGLSTNIQGDGTVPTYSAQNFLISSTRQIREVRADHTSIISTAPMLDLVEEWYVKAGKRANLETGRANAQYASLLVAEMAASGNLIPVSVDPGAWSQGDDTFAIELNAKALTAMGYQPSDVWRVASAAFDPSERARLFAVAASSTKEPSQRLTWIADTARASYDAAHFEEAIRTATFLAAAADTEIPANDPKTLSLQKTAKELQGWSLLRVGDVAKFNELASLYAAKYAVSKEDFKEPTSPLPNKLDQQNYFVWFNYNYSQPGSLIAKTDINSRLWATGRSIFDSTP